jgi:hypothetical protein
LGVNMAETRGNSNSLIVFSSEAETGSHVRQGAGENPRRFSAEVRQSECAALAGRL